MRACAFAWLGLLVLLAPGRSHAGSFEDAVLDELNRVRADPQAYARELRRTEISQAHFGDGAGLRLLRDPEAYAGPPAPPAADPDAVDDENVTPGDPAAVADAIGFLMRLRPVAPLQPDRRLAAAAREQVAQLGPTGVLGHGPPGNLLRRMQSQGVHASLGAESIAYGQPTPRDVIRQLIVDSGVSDRGHRKDLLSSAFQAAGVGCGGHAEWGSMCVIDMAGAIAGR